MTREEAIENLKGLLESNYVDSFEDAENEALEMAIKALEQSSYNSIKTELNGDTISRQAVLNKILKFSVTDGRSVSVSGLWTEVNDLPSVTPQEPKTGHCKDCKWWRDSDGVYRRGSHAESQCPINRREVFEGNGYCYMYEPQERSE